MIQRIFSPFIGLAIDDSHWYLFLSVMVIEETIAKYVTHEFFFSYQRKKKKKKTPAFQVLSLDSLTCEKAF